MTWVTITSTNAAAAGTTSWSTNVRVDDYDDWEACAWLPKEPLPQLPERREKFRDLGVTVGLPWPCMVRQFACR